MRHSRWSRSNLLQSNSTAILKFSMLRNPPSPTFDRHDLSVDPIGEVIGDPVLTVGHKVIDLLLQILC
jgi:hypothetical protein